MSAKDELIARIIAREGAIADVGDGRGVTRWGQTPRWLIDFDLPIPTDATDAAQNYAAWLHVTGLHQLVLDTVDPLADVVIDLAVHSGHVTAIKSLQKAVGAKADGVIGPITLGRVLSRETRQRAASDMIAWRLEQQGKLIEQDHDLARYAHGWARRNAEHVRRLCR